MSRPVTVQAAAALLKDADDVLILIHQYPDGDTIGSGYGLYLALTALHKRARVACCDAIPEKYDYLTAGITFAEFAPRFICTVDVADTRLLGALSEIGARAQLCIDHHATNIEYADALLLDASCGATAMIIYDVIRAMGVEVTQTMAECLYTGLATDTGCFKYENTTPAAHRLAAELIECGVHYAAINHAMFDLKSRARIELERLALDGMRYPFDGRCAVMTVTRAMVETAHAGENDMEGLAPIPRQIEGVWVGVTMREKADGSFKISLRTGPKADAAAIAAILGGGGHRRAAGCTVIGTQEQAFTVITDAIARTVEGIRQ